MAEDPTPAKKPAKPRPAARIKPAAEAAQKPAKPRAAARTKPAAQARTKPTAEAAKKLAKRRAAAPRKPVERVAKAPAKPRPGARAKVVEEAARSYFDAVSARDPDAMAAAFHPDGVDDIVPLGIFRGPEAVRQLFREMFAAMPDLAMVVERVAANDEVGVVQWRTSGTFEGGPFQGIEPTGRRVELRGCDVLEIDKDGLITRITGYYDGAAFARSIGLLPPQDSSVDKAMLAGFNVVTKVRRKVAAR